MNEQKLEWPLFNATEQAYMEINLNDDTPKTHLRQKGCNYWNDVYPSLLRIYLRRKGAASQSILKGACPHTEVKLFKPDRLRDYVSGSKSICAFIINIPFNHKYAI